MPHDSRIAGRLLRRIQARNRELLLEAAIEAGMGVLFTALTSAVVFCIAWFVCSSFGGFRFPAWTAALAVTAIYVLVSAISAWRQIDPFAGLTPMSDAQHLAIAVSSVLDGYVHINRHTVAGLAAILMGGPLNLVSALRTWLHRLPTGPALIDQAVDILSSCRPDVDLKKSRLNARAAVLLRRLNLIVPRADATVLALTEKGRDLVGDNPSIQAN
jgi:hypothetical protein